MFRFFPDDVSLADVYIARVDDDIDHVTVCHHHLPPRLPSDVVLMSAAAADTTDDTNSQVGCTAATPGDALYPTQYCHHHDFYLRAYPHCQQQQQQQFVVNNSVYNQQPSNSAVVSYPDGQYPPGLRTPQ